MPTESTLVAASTTVARRTSLVASRSSAATIAAKPPFTSQVPRPYMRSSHTSGVNGSIDMPSTGTVS